MSRARYEIAIAKGARQCGGCSGDIGEGEDYGIDPDLAAICMRCIECFEEEDTKTMYAVIEFQAPVKYLTDDGEEPESDGWAVVKGDLIKAVAGIFPVIPGIPDDKRPTAKFVEWRDD
tara:strand:+ start:84 stop:437 length:354 start_codon:yes stop_codon:yes gene_type:complete